MDGDTAGDRAEPKRPSPRVRAAAAVMGVAVLAAGVWGLGKVLRNAPGDGAPAECSATDGHLPARYVSGARLCAALNRQDLPDLLRTPAERTVTAGGRREWVTPDGGMKVADCEAHVALESYSVKLSASYDASSVAGRAAFETGSAQKRTVLGHPAVLYSDRTASITLDGEKAGTGRGGHARRLMVAMDEKDRGDSFEIVIWRQDGRAPDDTALLRVAEKVLPTVPGWSAGDEEPQADV
ncbi:DUF6215 domain-containing protein [Streptomyces sp. NPDC008313]|uniref:DUF6215 domain-containing protein n=1 Tax=Streptomyces sp. NPDC008313 TaxID=3364826 RepID=UPI0036E8A1AC